MAGGMDMKAVHVLCLAVICLLMALPVNSMGYQTTLFVSPIPSLSWGMSREEIVERFELNQTPRQKDSSFLWLTAEQLDWDPAEHLGLELGQSSAELGSIRIRFADEDIVYGPEGLDTLYAITFSVSAPNTQTVIHRLSRLYGAPIEVDINENRAWVVWACCPEELNEPNPRYPWNLGAGSDSMQYPHIQLQCENKAKGGVICEVSFYTGTGSYPAGSRIVWCPGQP